MKAKHYNRTQSEKKIRTRIISAGLLITLLSLVLFTFFCCSRKPDKRNGTAKITINKMREVSFDRSSQQPINILLLGSDSRTKNTAGLSDSIIIVHLNPKNYSADLISFPRDSRVRIPGHGNNKINAAMSYGGPKLAAQTIEELTGIEVHYYVVTTFLGFARIIDSLGGVQITLNKAIHDPWAQADLAAGSQKLNGAQALSFCRARHLDGGDLTRAAHQQDVLQAVFMQERDNKGPQQLLNLLNIFISNCETNLSYKEIFGLSQVVMQIRPDRVTKFVLPGNIANIGGGSYVILDHEQLKQTFDKIQNPS